MMVHTTEVKEIAPNRWQTFYESPTTPRIAWYQLKKEGGRWWFRLSDVGRWGLLSSFDARQEPFRSALRLIEGETRVF